MAPNNRTLVNFFDNHCFEKFRTADADTNQIHTAYAVDGIEVKQEEWARRQEEAIARDLKNLFPEKQGAN
ncbi:MAG: hypothetical protein EOO38_04275 [Cytophagaceae bacterium]|nr:MAG: hypothetical protein EOO38_04275 [Cytophagaceae bacterium]